MCPTGAERTDLPPFVVMIEYSVHNPTQGLEFVLPTDSHPHVSLVSRVVRLLIQA